MRVLRYISQRYITYNFTHDLGIAFGRSQRQKDQAHGPQIFDTVNQLISAGKEKLLEDSVRLGHFEMSVVRKVDAKIKNRSLHLFSLFWVNSWSSLALVKKA